ncbi:hypothetical protein Nepgr_018585 [Nepenthes gracilis]|uniref:RING-type domain-containing protein n=1 Tax=Nepenthes gracilis TaxID=150966 RepID=A0AAD3STU2_NEPGR|nr:hypothetical protein Nepgr_018585 [Nepenthes gracilis]
MMLGYQSARSTGQDSLKVIEADIQHANMLAASIPRSKSGDWLRMKLIYSHWAPLILYILQWIDCSCTCLLPRYLNLFHIVIDKVSADGRPNLSSHRRRASIQEFYGVILPYLHRLHGESSLLSNNLDEFSSLDLIAKKRPEERRKLSDNDAEREDECGICLEPCTKMVLPNCCHAMCINCYHDWSLRSESCPFCRGSLKRVKSADLWVLTCCGDSVDTKTVLMEDTLRFDRYINRLPRDIPDALFLVYYEYLI